MHILLQNLRIQQTVNLPTELLNTLKREGRRKGLILFDVLEKQWISGQCRFDKAGEGLFFVYKNTEIIGVGSVQQSPTTPPTAGIGLLQNCYILEKERGKGCGSQLYQKLINFAKIEFGQLQIPQQCPYYEQLGPIVNLMDQQPSLYFPKS